MRDKQNHKPNKTHHNIDYRELWGSPASAFNDLVASHHTPKHDVNPVGFSASSHHTEVRQPDYTQIFASWQLGSPGPVCGGIVAGDTGHVPVLTLPGHPGADTPLEKQHHDAAPIVIPPGGGCF